MSKKVFILLGATGSLAKEKIIPYLDKIDADIILYARRPIETKYDLVLGELDNMTPLLKFISSKNIDNLYFYLALPPDMFGSTINSIQNYFADINFKIALEKPFGTSFENAIRLSKTIGYAGFDKFYLIDHFMAKEALTHFLNLPVEKRREITDLKKIKSIEVSILEKESVEGRAAFYDKVGAIKDTGQNHLLNMLSVFLSPENKIDVLKNLKYRGNSLVTKQYSGYKNIDGVDPNSKTETYFKAEFDYKGVEITLETGKAQAITSTHIIVNYKNGDWFRLQIKPNLWETKTAHEYVIEDFITDGQKFSLTIKEALASWKIVDQILRN